MSFCRTIGYKWITVMDGIQFEFNDIISLYIRKTILNGDGLSV